MNQQPVYENDVFQTVTKRSKFGKSKAETFETRKLRAIFDTWRNRALPSPASQGSPGFWRPRTPHSPPLTTWRPNSPPGEINSSELLKRGVKSCVAPQRSLPLRTTNRLAWEPAWEPAPQPESQPPPPQILGIISASRSLWKKKQNSTPPVLSHI